MRRETLRSHSLRTALSVLITMVATMPSLAEFNNLDTTNCMAGATQTQTFDNDVAGNKQFSARTNPLGANVFWELGFSAVAGGLVCTPTPATGFATSYTCDNGISISLPAGASETASVVSTLPVTVTAPANAPIGKATFSLTATQDGGTGASCQNFYQVEVLSAKKPFDLAFVLDRSGSMDIASGTTGTRWDALETGVQTFLPFIELAARAPTPPGSRFGITFFESNVVNPNVPLFEILQGNVPSAAFMGVPGQLSGQSPNGGTGMGAGLQDGLDKATDLSRTRAIALFTDGDQNEPPFVATDGCSIGGTAINPPCPPPAATPGTPEPPRHRICTVGISTPSGTLLSTLQQLADHNGGATITTKNGVDFQDDTGVATDISSAFAACIGDLLQDNSPQQVAYLTGTFTDPSAPVTFNPFDVNRQVDRVMLSLTFSQRFETPTLERILSGIKVERDGVDVTGLFQSSIYGNFTAVGTLIADFTDPQAGPPEGTYTVTMDLPSDLKGIEYRLVPYVDDRRAEATSELSAAVTPVNQAVEISVQLGWIGAGITGADVVVRVFTPGGDMGDLLSKGEPVEIAEGADAINPGVQKYDFLAANDPSFIEALKLQPNAITMTDAGGGLYTAEFTLPDNVGLVHFVYDVLADDPQFGRIQRRWVESGYGAVDGIDVASSNPTAQYRDSILTLGFKPQRPSGKLVGPGQGGGFTINGTTLEGVRDMQDGTYTLNLGATKPETPIEISFGGEPIYSGPAGWGKVTRDDYGFVAQLAQMPPWIWLLVLLILLGLLWLVWRSRKTP